jgi:hypothetical protein
VERREEEGNWNIVGENLESTMTICIELSQWNSFILLVYANQQYNKTIKIREIYKWHYIIRTVVFVCSIVTLWGEDTSRGQAIFSILFWCWSNGGENLLSYTYTMCVLFFMFIIVMKRSFMNKMGKIFPWIWNGCY